ncbi:MAG: type VI secretion system tip protein VgrG [Polyangiaceae bacterium]|nr:type VI secretion system tip protein VgrG [Polyangiaceae bacterium]
MSDHASIQVDLVVEGVDATFQVLRLGGREAMNELSTLEVEFTTTEDVLGLDPRGLDQLFGKAATVALVDRRESHTRTLPLMILAVELVEETINGELRIELSLVPRIQLLAERTGHAIWVDKSTQQIVESLLENQGLGGGELDVRLSQAYEPRPQCVQYAETEWDYALRLLADDGISAWFDTKQEAPIWVLADTLEACVDIEGDAVLPFEDGAAHTQLRQFTEFELEANWCTGNVHLRDDDVRQPEVPIEGKLEDGEGLYFAYPARLLNGDQAAQRARARLDQLRRFELVARGSSDCVRLQPGRIFELYSEQTELNQRYLIVSVEHRFVESTPGKEQAAGYTNRVLMVPAGRFFRPAIPEWPTLPGLEPATVTGPAGEEIHVDDLGAVKLKFPWDRSDTMDDTTSTWARTMQQNLGGSMLLPRMNWEVLVAYAHGNPDQPRVLGRLYNAEAALPYSPKGQSASTSFQTASSPGGGAVNELKMGDSAGKESMSINAAKDQSVVVGGNALTTVAGNEDHTVASSSTLTSKTHSHSVGGAHNIDVGTDYTIQVGARSETIGGVEINKVTGSRIVKAGGAYQEVVGALQATQCINANLECAALANLVGGAMIHAAGAGANETVLGARSHVVGAVRGINCVNYEEKVLGVKAITSGASLLQAGAGNATQAPVINLSMTALTASAAADVVFDGATISIEAASLTAPGGSISGGTLKVVGSEVKGSITRKGVSELDA